MFVRRAEILCKNNVFVLIDGNCCLEDSKGTKAPPNSMPSPHCVQELRARTLCWLHISSDFSPNMFLCILAVTKKAAGHVSARQKRWVSIISPQPGRRSRNERTSWTSNKDQKNGQNKPNLHSKRLWIEVFWLTWSHEAEPLSLCVWSSTDMNISNKTIWTKIDGQYLPSVLEKDNILTAANSKIDKTKHIMSLVSWS